MGIEEDIQQRTFSSDNQKVLVNLIYTHNYVTDKMNAFFKKHEITRQQYNVLRILRGQYPNPSNINLIKERMLDKMSDASRIVERLRIKNLVNRCQSDLDKRAVEITISSKGLKLLEAMDHQVKQFEEVFSKLTEDEINDLNYLLDKIRQED